MKLIVILIAVPFLFIAPAFSDLTPANIDKLRLIIKEEVETAVAASERRLKDAIEDSEAKMMVEISKVNITVAEMDKRLNQIFTLVIGLIALIVVVVGIPQIIVTLQRKEVRAQDEKLEVQQRQLETQQNNLRCSKSRLKRCSDSWKHFRRNALWALSA